MGCEHCSILMVKRLFIILKLFEKYLIFDLFPLLCIEKCFCGDSAQKGEVLYDRGHVSHQTQNDKARL